MPDDNRLCRDSPEGLNPVLEAIRREQRGGSEKQRSEVWCLADNAPSCVYSKDLGRESVSCEATVEMVLSSPGGTLVREVEAVSAPGMTNQIVDSAESVKRTTELTAEQRMKTLTYSGG